MNGIDITDIIDKVDAEGDADQRIILFGLAFISAVNHHKTKHSGCIHKTLDAMGVMDTYERIYKEECDADVDKDIRYALDELTIRTTKLSF